MQGGACDISTGRETVLLIRAILIAGPIYRDMYASAALLTIVALQQSTIYQESF